MRKFFRFFKRALLLLILLAAAGAGLTAYMWEDNWGEPAGAYVFEQVLENRLGNDLGDYYDNEYGDGLLLGVCGAGGPMPDPDRGGPCLFVRAGEQIFVVDAGNSAARNLGIMQVPFDEVRALLVTHFHSDHIDGLGELMLQRWIAGGWDSPLPVMGPVGVDQVVEGFNLAYALDQGWRTAHHGSEIAPPSGFGAEAEAIAVSSNPGASTVIHEGDGLRITAFRVNHDPVTPALAYRFDYRGRSLLISGDTSPTESLNVQAKNVDLLVHEALQPKLVELMAAAGEEQDLPLVVKIAEDIPGYHTSPEDAAALAQRSGVDHLLLYHLVPPVPGLLFNRVFLGDARKNYSGPITLAEDGTLLFLPVGSDLIEAH